MPAAQSKILITDREVYLNEVQLVELGKRANVVHAPNWEELTLIAQAKGADVIVHSFFPSISAAIIGTSDNLKATVKYGVGTDNVDVETATRLGVMVVNCPEYGTGTVADLAFALLISLARKIPAIDHATKETAWVWPTPEFIGVDLADKTIGFVGFGRIGRAMCKRAAGFDMQPIYYDPYVTQEEVAFTGALSVGLDELLEHSDFVTIHCILTPETRGLIDAAALRRMKVTANLIDVSRGAIIDEAALVQALDERWIAGAGIDVFSVEPLTEGYPLLQAPNTILTSHLAWYTLEADARLAAECMNRITEILDGNRPKNVINRKALGL